MRRHNGPTRPELEDGDDLEHRRREGSLRELPRGLEDVVPPMREDYDAERTHEDRDERGRMM